MADTLSVLIPARNEHFGEIDLLALTVANVLEHSSEATNVIVIADGSWPLKPLDCHPRLTVVHHNTSIGQRAACNEAARLSTARYVMKLDAHCAVAPGFDVALMAQCEYNWTVIPIQYNLHAFSWKCKSCKHETYQGPKPDRCVKCQSQYLKQVVKWLPRGWKERGGVWEGRPKTTSWYFDTTLHFQYDGSMAQRYPPEQKLTPAMTCLGACWFLHRERYWELDGMDEKHGSWGNQGVEIALKSWLSGGQLLVNHNTWFAHLFRTQSGPMGTLKNFSFPYANPGGERAKARSREIWLQNKWPKQVHPLSWLIEKFRPVRDWHTFDNPVLAQVNAAGKAFRVIHPLTGNATPAPSGGVAGREQMTPNAMGTSSLVGAGAATAKDVDSGGNKSQVDGITASAVATDVIDNKSVSPVFSAQRPDKPSPYNSVKSNLGTIKADTSISTAVGVANPEPAASGLIDQNATKDAGDLLSIEVGDGEQVHAQIIPRKLVLYYTCNSHDATLELAARNNLKAATNGHEIGCVALQRTDFGDWTIVVNREKSGGTMHYQILAGLERSTADYVFLCESDVFYHKSHFDFTPPRDDTIYYNTNVWRIRYADGHAVRTDNLQQVSGICANRQLLLEHYRKRVEIIERNNGVFDAKRMAYEPGTRGDLWGIKVANWESPFPNIDITGHGQTLTTPHFSVDSFRNKKYAEGWKETDEALPGWPKLAGRIPEFLAELANGGTVS